MEIGIGMFGDIAGATANSKAGNAHQKLQELILEAQLADTVGLDVFGLGEHHRPDYAVSSPEIVLAAIATATQRIKLMSTVTVLSSAEPVKVYQDFATIDLLSNGRAEIGVGRGSFIESFPLFGYDLKDYNTLFEEKLDLLLQINNKETVSWKGTLRAPLVDQRVLPRALNNGQLPIWIAVGGTPESVQRAARLGLPLIVAIIGGNLSQFQPLVQFYKQEYLRHGHNPAAMQIGIHAHTFISEQESDIDNYFQSYGTQMNRIGASRGWPPYSSAQFEAGRRPDGALFVGSPEMVIEKINYAKSLFGLTRFIAHTDVGSPSHEVQMKNISLLGNVIAPAVR